MWPSRDAAHRVGDRLVVVVAVDQHREDARDRAGVGARAGAFEEPRQFGEHGRGIALGGRRLAGREADLALRHRKARDRIHQRQHVLALVAEIFGDSERQVAGLAAHQRRLVRGRDHDDRAREARFAEIVLQEFLHLAAALADQADHRDIGVDVARQHREQHGFADAGARENAHALATAAGEEGVDRAHAEIERRADAAARMRRRRRCAERIRRRPKRQRALAVDRLAHGVDDAAEPAGARADAPATADTTARQPRRTPSSGANGISSAFVPVKPTTSQGIALAPAVSITTRAPTDIAWIGPATSTIRPRTPTTRP